MASRMHSPTHMAASHTIPQLTIWERLHRYIAIPAVIFKCTFGLFIDTLCLRITSVKSLKRNIVKQVAKASSLFSLRQNRSLQPPTGETIADQCKINKLTHQTVRLGVDGFAPATLHFIDCGPQDQGNILLFLHGGAYLYPANPMHVTFARIAAKTSGSNLAMLEYTLAPESKYPSQLAQGIAALQFLLDHHKPSEIIIGGDSGGGNLTLGILAHLRKPHPQIAPVDKVDDSDKLRAAFCISPRCSNAYSKPSFRTNASTDIIGADLVKMISVHWQPVLEHVWATPMRGDQQFWATLLARKIILVAGGNECYVDDIKDFAALIGAEQDVLADRAFCICPGEYHDQCIIDLRLGIGDGSMTTNLMEWFRSL